MLPFNFSLFDVCFQNLLNLCTGSSNNIRSPNPDSTFILKSTERIYYLLAPSIESMRIWFDVLATEVETFQNIWIFRIFLLFLYDSRKKKYVYKSFGQIVCVYVQFKREITLVVFQNLFLIFYIFWMFYLSLLLLLLFSSYLSSIFCLVHFLCQQFFLKYFRYLIGRMVTLWRTSCWTFNFTLITFIHFLMEQHYSIISLKLRLGLFRETQVSVKM